MLDTQWVYTLDVALFSASCVLVALVPFVCSCVNKRRLKRLALRCEWIQATQTFLTSEDNALRLKAHQRISHGLMHHTHLVLSLWLDASERLDPEFRLKEAELLRLFEAFTLDTFMFDWLQTKVSTSKKELALRLLVWVADKVAQTHHDTLRRLLSDKNGRNALLAAKALMRANHQMYTPEVLHTLVCREDWLMPHASSFVLPFPTHSREALYVASYLAEVFSDTTIPEGALKWLLLLRKVDASLKHQVLTSILKTLGNAPNHDALYQEALQQLTYSSYASTFTTEATSASETTRMVTPSSQPTSEDTSVVSGIMIENLLLSSDSNGSLLFSA
ncbi:MAG: hypothetical protein ACKO37_00785 [Vampirovibrionales bacterium]